MSFLDGDLASEINDAFRDVFLAATLSRTSYAAGANAWTPGTATTTTHACRAIHEEWSVGILGAGLVNAGEVELLILARSLTVEPAPGDVVTITGRGTWTIVPQDAGRAPVATDPAKAVWTCRARA